MTDFALQRKNMVESQVRPSDVTDRRVIRAMLEIPREAFVPASLRAIAYMDGDLPLAAAGAQKRALLAPRVLAKMIQALEIDERSNVLDVGATTGYAAAIMAQIAAKVTAIETAAALAELARTALAGLGIKNAVVEGAGSLTGGWPKEAPFDAILVEGAVPAVPDALLDQLKDGGQLVAVVTGRGVGRVMRWRRLGGTFDVNALFDAGAMPLPGFERTPEFVF